MDDSRAILRTGDPALFCRKFNRVKKDVRKLEAANRGDVKAFAHILDLAYGRKGKLKRELMEPFLSDPKAGPPPQIILSVDKSRPPVYSPELRTLLTSSLSRMTKPLRHDAFERPQKLPLRSASEVQLLGGFSKRREVNIRWRYFTAEWKKVFPPLQTIVCKEDDADRETSYGSQWADVFQSLQQLVGPPLKARNLTRKELQRQGSLRTTPIPLIRHHNSRWLRRRFQQLLGRIPILISPRPNSEHGQMAVALSPSAIGPSLRFSPDRVPDATPADIEWSNVKKS
ncbi:hypothetical protein APHAL10511_006084 [Amanita phalloides]|nr:hypothetical protein APHAL10511_006084 [Amanita phalloides]